ncbi:hypothetical protein COOONC_23716 [Cooperia oncophora]
MRRISATHNYHSPLGQQGPSAKRSKNVVTDKRQVENVDAQKRNGEIDTKPEFVEEHNEVSAVDREIKLEEANGVVEHVDCEAAQVDVVGLLTEPHPLSPQSQPPPLSPQAAPSGVPDRIEFDQSNEPLKSSERDGVKHIGS